MSCWGIILFNSISPLNKTWAKICQWSCFTLSSLRRSPQESPQWLHCLSFFLSLHLLLLRPPTTQSSLIRPWILWALFFSSSTLQHPSSTLSNNLSNHLNFAFLNPSSDSSSSPSHRKASIFFLDTLSSVSCLLDTSSVFRPLVNIP